MAKGKGSVPQSNYRTREIPQNIIEQAEVIAQQETTKIVQKTKKPFPKRLKVSFRSQGDCEEFSKLIKAPIHVDEKTIQFAASQLKSLRRGQFIGTPIKKVRKESDQPDSYKHWRGMPEFKQEQNNWIHHSLIVTFKTKTDYAAFANVVRQPITLKTKSIYYPKWTKANVKAFVWRSSLPRKAITPRYPIYIVSKGRAYSRLTSKALEAMGVPYRIVIEPAEYDSYASVIAAEKILTLPYDTDPENPTGPGRAREWCASHSASEGFKRHFVMDDNISTFYRLHQNRRYKVADGAIFRAAEDFVDRYENILVAGFQYRFFVAQKEKYPPFVTNTRIYSCLLIDNRYVFELPRNAPDDTVPKVIKRPKQLSNTQFLWRERYNEDTILSLDALSNGYCTVQFNTFLQGKAPTQKMAGGNSEVFYSKEGTAEIKFSGDGRYNPAGTINKSVNLQICYPNVTTVKIRFQRLHHVVDYSSYKINKL